MNANTPLPADGQEIAAFVDALFRYADEGTFVSLRAFYDDRDGRFASEGHCVTADIAALVDAATRLANRCASAEAHVVFCPPVATFIDAKNATEENLANGLALSVECDKAPATARAKLESLLGPATVIVASGGEWTDPETGEIQNKLHLHWRLNEPTCDAASHAKLKQARTLATRLVGGDASNTPIVHPIRWPGSWHRKGMPRLARIVSQADRDLDLVEALERLQDAVGSIPPEKGDTASSGDPKGDARQMAELVRAILNAEDYHAPLVALAMRYLKGGMRDAHAVQTLQGLMLFVPEAERDLKDGTPQPGRWQARYDDIPRGVSTARGKLDAAEEKTRTAETLDALDPSRYRLDVLTEGEPPPQRFLLKPLMPLGVVGLLFGPGGVGKSMLALDLCLTVAGRGKIAGTVNHVIGPLGGIIPPEAAGASVFITLEDSKDEIHRRAATLDPERKHRTLPCFIYPAIEIADFEPALIRAEGRTAALTAFAREGLDRLLTNIARANGPVRLLVLDPAGDFIEADENSAEAVKPLMRQLRAISNRHGCTIILLGHVAKVAEGVVPTMRGSSAWVANSRFAFALYRPGSEEAKTKARSVGCRPEALVCGLLEKANHAGAPVGVQRWFARDRTGRLIDVAPLAVNDAGPDDETLLDLLVAACGEAAAAGMPYTVSGVPGLYENRADLPAELAELSKTRLAALGNAAVAAKRLVKARNNQAQGTTKYLDVPDGPLATGTLKEMVMGSRADAIAKYRAQKAAAASAAAPLVADAA